MMDVVVLPDMSILTSLEQSANFEWQAREVLSHIPPLFDLVTAKPYSDQGDIMLEFRKDGLGVDVVVNPQILRRSINNVMTFIAIKTLAAMERAEAVP